MLWLLKKTLMGYHVRSTKEEKEEIKKDRNSEKEGKEERSGMTCILLGELAKFGLNAAMPHAHPGQSRTDISGCPWKHKTARFKR